MALATANGTERNRLVRDQLFPVDFYKGVYRRKEGRGAGQEELNGQVSVDLSRAYKHQA